MSGWRFLLRLAGWLDAPPRLIGRAVSWAFLPMILIIIVDALSRKYLRKLDFVVENDLHGYFNSPIFQDAEWHLHTIIFLGALGYAYSRNAHVRLDIIRPKLGEKGRLWVEFLCGLTLLLPFLAVIAYYAWDFFILAWESDEGSGVNNGIEDRWAIKFWTVLGPVLLMLAGTAMLLRLFVRLFGPEAVAGETRTEAIADENFSAYG